MGCATNRPEYQAAEELSTRQAAPAARLGFLSIDHKKRYRPEAGEAAKTAACPQSILPIRDRFGRFLEHQSGKQPQSARRTLNGTELDS